MGTVNYKTSDIITLGLRPYEPRDFELDPDFMEDARERCEENGCSLFDWIEGTINEYTEDDRQTAENIISRYSFEFFQVSIEPGYYEGFSLDIESNFPIAFNDWTEKREAQKEITEIKQFLLACVDLGLCQVWPGWCTKYQDRQTTIAAISEAVKEMREDARQTTTWSQYERQEAI